MRQGKSKYQKTPARIDVGDEKQKFSFAHPIPPYYRDTNKNPEKNELPQKTPYSKAGNEKNPQPKLHEQIMEKLKKQFSTTSESKVREIVEEMFKQLQIKRNQNDQNDWYDLANILCEHLKYPSTELARVHRHSNRLGEYDLQTKSSSKISSNTNPQLVTCKCCRLPRQKQLSGLTGLDEIKNIGMSTHLFFLAIQNLMILLLVMCLTFSFYSILTNISSSQKYGSSYKNGQVMEAKLNSFNGVLSTALGSKVLLKDSQSNNNILKQCWLGAGTVLIWGLLFVWIKVRQRKQYAEIKNAHPSPASFTLVFKNMPKQLGRYNFQQQLDQYKQKINGKEVLPIVDVVQVAPFFIDKSILEDSNYLKMKKEAQVQKDVIRGWIKERKQRNLFSSSKQQREQILKRFTQHKKDANDYIDLHMIEAENKQRKQILKKDLADYFVTFVETERKQLMEKIHHTQQSLFFNLPCFRRKNYFNYVEEKRYGAHEPIVTTFQPIIKPAPEPEDVKWKNLGETKCERISMWVLTFFITLVLLCITFISVFLLTSAQQSYSLRQQKVVNQKWINFAIAKGISIIIVVFNTVIGIVLNLITEKESHERESHEQISIGLKTILATLINTIILPITVNFVITANLFGVDGLADAVFSLAISDAILGSFLVWLNPSYWINIFVFKWYSRPSKKLYLNQKYLNMINQRNKFAVGQSYANIICKFLFACFFASLQPLVVPLALLGLFLTYLAQKYNLFKKYRRPILGTKQINDSLFSVIYLGPLFYTLGSLLWTNLVPKTFIDSLPNMVALALSLLILITPIRLIARELTKNSNYEKNYRIYDFAFLNSYKTMNPLLKEQFTVRIQDFNARQEPRQNQPSEKFKHECLLNTNDGLLIAGLFGDRDE